MNHLVFIIFALALIASAEHVTNPDTPVVDEDGYLPVDFSDPYYYRCSHEDDTPSGHMYYACMSKHTKEDPVEFVDKMLRLGAYPDVIHERTKRPVIQSCMARNFTKTVQLLVDRGASLMQENAEGWNTCQAACFEGLLDIVKICHEAGVDMVSETHTKYHYINHACAGKTWGHAETTRFLLELGVDPDIRSRDENTSCMEQWAAYDNVKSVLIEFGAKTKPITRQRKKVHPDL
jgi:ankyrin repeat protein